MKICTKCKIEKSKQLFGIVSRNKDSLNINCLDCQYQIRRLKYLSNSEKIKDRVQKYRDNNKNKIKNLSKKYRDNNREILKEKKRLDYKNNIETRRFEKRESSKKNLSKILARNKKRKLNLESRTPKWLSKNDIKTIELLYIYAAKLKNKYDVNFHVDHIIPLNGKTVSGLHVPWNLRVITQEDNLKKSNKLVVL